MELETLQGARGFALRAPYPRGRCPLRYRAHPFPLHRGCCDAAHRRHDEVSRFAARRPRSGLTLTRNAPKTLSLEEGKGCKAFPSCLAASDKRGLQRGLLLCWGVGQSPAATAGSASAASGKIPFRVMRSVLTKMGFARL